jgi:uncharacterized repeat protein (TIGR03803 family)
MKRIIMIFLSLASHCISNAQTPELWAMAQTTAGNDGIIFKINGDGSGFTNIYQFLNSTGATPRGKFSLFNNNGKLYGTTFNGGINNYGVLFSFDTLTNTYSDLWEFNDTIIGREPNNNLLLANDGRFYGSCVGINNHNNTIFCFDPSANSITVVDTNWVIETNFMQASNNLLYAVAGGGVNNAGILISLDITTSIIDTIFSYPVNTNIPTDVITLYNALLQASNGLLYGMAKTTYNGISPGYLYSYDLTTNTFANLFSFHDTLGESPNGSLIQATNGLIYGLTSYGGDSSKGTMFSYDPVTLTYNKLHDFYRATGSNPFASLMQASDGGLYATTSVGGLYNFGVVFRYDISTNTYIDIHDFDIPNGRNCIGDLIEMPRCIAPVLNVNNNQHICIGNSITLTVSGANSYTWQSNSSTDSSITVTPTVTTSYIVTGSNGNCSRTDTIVVTVTSSLTPAIIGASSVCAGNSITLDAGSFSFYSWSNGSTLETITINSANTYTVTVTDNSGCTGTASQSVTVNPLPTPAITGGNSFCSGDSTTLTVNSYSHYHWNTGAGNPSITVTASGTYIVTVTDNNGCTGTASQAITVNQLPVPLITGDTSFCSGSSSTLNAGSFAHYIWSTGSTAQTITVDSATTYHITVTDANGCTGIASRTITVYSLPHPVITSNGSDTFCQGNSVMLTVGIYPGYLWNTAATTPSITAIDSTTYIVTVTNANGCTGTASRTITVHASPSPTISGGNTICSGDSLILNVGSFAHYLWNNGITTQSINATASGNYSITVTNSGGCTGIASETVSVTANPVPVIAPASPINLCEGENVTLHASNGILYNWSNGATTQYLDVSASGTYSVTVTYGVNCSNTSAPTDVIVHPLPIATIAALPENLEFCIGDSILLTANSSTSPITYLWNQGSTTQSIEATQSGDFTVIVTDTIGCHSSSSINLTSYLYPVANFTYSIFLNTTTFTNTSTNGTAYQWYFGDGNVSTLMNPTHTYSHDSTYTITLIVTNPCGADTVRYTITLTGINEINVSNSFYIFPNPANNQVKISFSSDREESYNVRLIDVTGRTIITDNQIAVSGDDHYLMDVSTIARGVYIVSLQKRDAVLKSKLVIQ